MQPCYHCSWRRFSGLVSSRTRYLSVVLCSLFSFWFSLSFSLPYYPLSSLSTHETETVTAIRNHSGVQKRGRFKRPLLSCSLSPIERNSKEDEQAMERYRESMKRERIIERLRTVLYRFFQSIVSDRNWNARYLNLYFLLSDDHTISKSISIYKYDNS